MQERNSETLLRFLRLVGSANWHASELFLLGDIFDLWLGEHKYFQKRYAPIIDEIRRIVDRKIAVFYVEGNHDLYLKPFWQDQVGVEVISDFRILDVQGSRVRVEHGDLINPDDKGYLFLRELLRSESVTWLARNLPAGVVSYIGERASQMSRSYTANKKHLAREKIIEMIRQHAQDSFEREAFDWIFTGHVHVEDRFEFIRGGRMIRSVNLGSWFENPKVFCLHASAEKSRFLPLS